MFSFHNVSVSFGGEKILQDVSFPLAPHKITAVLGKNGSGKSTLVSCVTNQVNYTGAILYGEKNIALISARERAQLVAVLPQILPKTSLTVEELTAMGRNPYLDLGKRLSETDKRQIEYALNITGMEKYKSRRVDSLSGGERQTAYLSMVLAQNTRIIILDEPTTYMDMENEAQFLSLLQELKTKHKKTIMTVMHDLTKAVELADRILVMNRGKNIFFGSSEECVDSGVIERNFGAKRSGYEKDGVFRTLYYR